MLKTMSSYSANGVLALLVIALSSPASCSGRGDTKAGPSAGHGTASELVVFADELRSSIIAGDRKRVLHLLSLGGIRFGPDESEVAFEVVATDFENRGEISCGFFDGECLRKLARAQQSKGVSGGRPNLPMSLSEQLSGNKEIQTKTTKRNASTGVITYVIPDADEQKIVEFELSLENGQWRVAGIPTW